MNIDKKTCINIGIVAFLLYLAIHYWDGLVGLFNLFLAAAGTLINGAIIAYVLNILMRFYERHMAPNTKKKVWNAMRRPVCMALAFLTLVAVIVALIQIILPQLISCVQVLLSSLPGVLRQMYDKLMENPTIAALMVDYNLVLPATEQEWREIIERAANLLFNGAGNVVNTAVSFTTSVIGSILSLLMSLIFTFNILIGKETLQRQSRNLLHRVLGDTRMARAMHIISTLDDCFHNYIVGQCTEAVILGTLCTIGMTLLRLDYAGYVRRHDGADSDYRPVHWRSGRLHHALLDFACKGTGIPDLPLPAPAGRGQPDLPPHGRQQIEAAGIVGAGGSADWRRHDGHLRHGTVRPADGGAVSAGGRMGAP